MDAVKKERLEEARFMGQQATPRSEQRRSAWGSLEMSLQMVKGACTSSRKCVRKDGHTGNHWPHDKEN